MKPRWSFLAFPWKKEEEEPQELLLSSSSTTKADSGVRADAYLLGQLKRISSEGRESRGSSSAAGIAMSLRVGPPQKKPLGSGVRLKETT